MAKMIKKNSNIDDDNYHHLMELKKRRWSKLWRTVTSFGFGNDDVIQRYNHTSIELKQFFVKKADMQDSNII